MGRPIFQLDDVHFDVELLPHLALQCRRMALAVVDLASGKLPHPSEVTSGGAPCHEDALILLDNGRDDHDVHARLARGS